MKSKFLGLERWTTLVSMLSDARGLGFTFTAVLCVLCAATVLALRLRNRTMQPPRAETAGTEAAA